MQIKVKHCGTIIGARAREIKIIALLGTNVIVMSCNCNFCGLSAGSLEPSTALSRSRGLRAPTAFSFSHVRISRIFPTDN